MASIAALLSALFVTPFLIVASAQPAAKGRAASTASFGVKIFNTDCAALAYQEYGVGKPIVVLAGGPGMNPAYMDPVARMLASSGRRAVLLHQRGTGRSADAIRCRERMTLKGAVADLDDLRMSLGLRKLTLVGHSWGGMLAMAYAQQYPDRVAGLLLLDPGPIESASFSTEEAAILARLTPAERAAAKEAGNGAPVEKIERRAFFAHPENARLLEESIPAGAPLWYESVGSLLGPDLEGFDVREALRVLDAPVEMVLGREDPGFFTAEQIRALHPKSVLIVIENAGHYPWLESTGETSAALQKGVAALP
jgi:proline iminopeptidase